MNKKEYFSKNYNKVINFYKKLHIHGNEYEDAENIFDGKSLRFFFKPIKQVIDITNSTSIIDFGCGKAKYYFEEVRVDQQNYNNIQDYWKIKNYFLYDPGVSYFSNYPNKKADGVICVDVVEHIPENDMQNFLMEIFKLSNKFVFIVIACYPANKKLPDGRNVHLCIKSPDEWQKIFFNIKQYYPKIRQFIICAKSRKNYVSIS